MAEPVSPIQFEDVPLEEARRMGRGPRMDPQLYQELRTRMQALSDQAVRLTIPDGTSQATMKRRIQQVAAELGIPVTIRRVSGGLLFWRSTDEDRQLAKEVGSRLQTAQRVRPARPRGRPRRTYPPVYTLLPRTSTGWIRLLSPPLKKQSPEHYAQGFALVTERCISNLSFPR